jgi:hypothetical protein
LRVSNIARFAAKLFFGGTGTSGLIAVTALERVLAFSEAL